MAAESDHPRFFISSVNELMRKPVLRKMTPFSRSSQLCLVIADRYKLCAELRQYRVIFCFSPTITTPTGEKKESSGSSASNRYTCSNSDAANESFPLILRNSTPNVHENLAQCVVHHGQTHRRDYLRGAYHGFRG